MVAGADAWFPETASAQSSEKKPEAKTIFAIDDHSEGPTLPDTERSTSRNGRKPSQTPVREAASSESDELVQTKLRCKLLLRL